jgi:hypothetical protein
LDVLWSFPADSSGTVTIPPAVLQNIPGGTYPTPQGFTIGRWNTTIDTASGKDIGVQAQEFIATGIQITP